MQSAALGTVALWTEHAAMSLEGAGLHPIAEATNLQTPGIFFDPSSQQ